MYIDDLRIDEAPATDHLEIAERIAAAINRDGRATAEVREARNGNAHVYLAREGKRRGRPDQIGYIEVLAGTGELVIAVTRNTAHYRDLARAAVAS